jgi:hypothetical protein
VIFLEYLGVWGSIVGDCYAPRNVKLAQKWGGSKMGGNWNAACILLNTTKASIVWLERFLPHRQCWEQERTTCSGGYPSATCSAFLHYCDGGVSYENCFCSIYGLMAMVCIMMDYYSY